MDKAGELKEKATHERAGAEFACAPATPLSLALIEWDDRAWCDLPMRLQRWGVGLTPMDGPPPTDGASGLLIIRRWPTPLVLHRLSEATAATHLPVLLCTAAPSAMRGAVLECGIADVLHPEMHARELMARIMARCGEQRTPQRMQFGALKLDRLTRHVTLNGQNVRLTALQFDLLAAVMAGVAISAEALWRQIWGIGFDPGTNRIAVHIHHIRRALQYAGGGVEIHAEGGGYILVLKQPA